MNFVLSHDQKDTVIVKLEQDGDDVNIVTNGKIHVWFAAETSTLTFNSDDLHSMGIKVEDVA